MLRYIEILKANEIKRLMLIMCYDTLKYIKAYEMKRLMLNMCYDTLKY